MSPPIRDGSGDSIRSIRLGDGSEISEVRTGAGDVLFSAIPDSGAYRLTLDESTPSDSFNNNDFSKSASGVTTGVAGLDLKYESNTAYQLDGTDGDLGLGEALDLSGGWTFTIPIKLDPTVDTDDTVFDTFFGSTNDFIRFVYNDPDLDVRVRDGDGNDNTVLITDSNVPIDTTVYYQIVGFENGDVELRKGDASVVGTDTSTYNGFSNFTATTNGDITYGTGQSFGTADNIPMTIDDPRLYFKGLSSTESSDLYNTGSI